MSVVSIGFVGQQDTSHHNTSGTHASSAMSGRSATGWSPGIGTGTPGRSSTERHAERHHGSHAVGRILVVVATPSLLSDRIMPRRAGRGSRCLDESATPFKLEIEISCIPRNLIIVIFYYQISLKPLKTLSLSQVSFPLLFPLYYIVPPVFTNSDKGKYKGKKIL